MPWDYYQLCPAEFRDMVRAHRKRHEQTWERTAWSVSKLMNISGKVVKQPVTVAKLLGRVIKTTRSDKE
jgi:hypothetical protein